MRFRYLHVFLILSASFIAACGGGDAEKSTLRRPLATTAAVPAYDEDDLYRFFAIAFGAAPGVTYMAQLKQAADYGLSIKQIVNIFTTKPQFLETYPTSLSNREYAQKLVDNVVGTSAAAAAKAEAVEDIVAALSLQDWTRGDITYAIFNNLAKKPTDDAKWAGTAKKMANQVAYARYFTEVLKEATTNLSALRQMVSTVDETTPTPKLALALDPKLLPNLKTKYDKLCGRDVNAQLVVPVDLNRDRRLDLIVALWCFQPTFNQIIDTPVKHTIIALIQSHDGTFLDATREVFGSELPDIGGIASAYTTNDFNNDGYTDVVFAVNREDGRGGTGSMDNFKSRPMSLISNGDGTYRLVPLGDPLWGMTISTRITSSSDREVIISGYHGTNTGFKWINGNWREVPGFSTWVDNPLFLKANSNVAIQKGRREELGIDLFTLANGAWVKASAFSFSGTTTWIDQVSWTGATGKVPVINIGGEDYITPGFSGFCELQSGNTTKIAAFMAGTIIIGGYKGGMIYENEGADPIYKYRPANKILLFLIEGSSLSKDSIELDLSEDGTVAFWGMQCDDLNGDGLNDIHVTSARGWRPFKTSGPFPSPIVFFSHPEGGFKRARNGIFPRIPDGAAALFSDVNGDNVTDLIYWPLTKYSGDDAFEGNDALIRSDSVRYKLYEGVRNINSLDLRP
jgi:hypothetical protein